MNRSLAQLTDLPDELLLIILKKLENTDVLYSLLGLYTRLDQTIRDPCFTTEIDLIKANEAQSTRMDTLIDRFCMDILPEIHHRIRWLKLRSTTMERILLAAHYSNLSQLDIFIPDNEPILPFGGEETFDFRVLQSSMHEHRSTCVQFRVKTLSQFPLYSRKTKQKSHQ